jgi:hypothetical protein
VGVPSQPRELYEQLPTCQCVINGVCVGGSSCTMYAAAHGVDQATLGKQRPSGCALRKASRDSSGGTTLLQASAAVDALSSTKLTVYVGNNVRSLRQLADDLYRGRSVVLQGNCSALRYTPFRSTQGAVNHAVFLSRGYGFDRGEDGLFIPDSVKVYDPIADGRRAAWGTAARGPDVWPWATVRAFAGALRPFGDNDSRTLAKLRPGKAYAGLFPDTEPHVHLRYAGSARTDPFPKKMTIRSPAAGRKVNIRKGPSTSYAVVATAVTGQGFNAYQVNKSGQSLAGSRVWYGNHDGDRWVHSSGVK